MKYILIYYGLINIIAFLAYGTDKRLAVTHKRRISEKSLILLAFMGGGIGAYAGMQVFRHKTKHIKFLILVPMAVVVHIILWIIIGNL